MLLSICLIHGNTNGFTSVFFIFLDYFLEQSIDEVNKRERIPLKLTNLLMWRILEVLSDRICNWLAFFLLGNVYGIKVIRLISIFSCYSLKGSKWLLSWTNYLKARFCISSSSLFPSSGRTTNGVLHFLKLHQRKLTLLRCQQVTGAPAERQQCQTGPLKPHGFTPTSSSPQPPADGWIDRESQKRQICQNAMHQN